MGECYDLSIKEIGANTMTKRPAIHYSRSAHKISTMRAQRDYVLRNVNALPAWQVKCIRILHALSLI